VGFDAHMVAWWSYLIASGHGKPPGPSGDSSMRTNLSPSSFVSLLNRREFLMSVLLYYVLLVGYIVLVLRSSSYQ
jgi:hypothetical protein